jgi:hypothetical protein
MAEPPKKYVLPLGLSSSPYGTRNLPPPLVERYTQMQTTIAEIQKILAELPPPPTPATPDPSGGMGHNNPPEGLEIEPSDIGEIKEAVEVLKVQRPSAPDKGAEALQAVERIESKVSKLREWLERRGEEFASEATKAAGKQAGTWLSVTAVGVLVDKLLGLSTVVRAWIDALLLLQ